MNTSRGCILFGEFYCFTNSRSLPDGRQEVTNSQRRTDYLYAGITIKLQNLLSASSAILSLRSLREKKWFT